MTVAAGWYADPADPAWVRWWDGAAWSSEVHPAAPAGSPIASAPAPVPLAPAAPAAPVVLAPVSMEPISLAPVAMAPAMSAPERSSQATTAPVPLAPVTLAPAGAIALAPSPAPGRTATPLLEPLSVVPDTVLGGVATPVIATRPEPVRSLEHSTAASTTHETRAPAAYAPAGPATTTATAEHAGPPSARSTSSHASSGWDAGVAVAGAATGGSRFGGGPATGGGASGFGPMRPGASLSAPVVALPSAGAGRIVKRMIAGAVVAALLIAAVVVVVLPRIRDKQAVEAAAVVPSVLPHSAPKSLAGQKAVKLPGVSPAATTSTVTAKGATWAWAASYGKTTDYTYYLAGDVPADTRADAMKAQTDPAAVARLLESVTSSMSITASSTPATSSAREYGSKVGGKAWCMPITMGRNGGGYCLWTNGKEFLQVLNFPSVQEVSAKHTIAALTQLAAITAKAATAATAAK